MTGSLSSLTKNAGIIYDGSFSGNLTDRDGVTAELLASHGIKVYTEEEIDHFLKDYS